MLLRRDPARDDDELIRYLLGELAEDQSDRFDERSVVDDEFAGRLRVAEEGLVDAYVTGRLSGPRRVLFESVYLASPRRREKVAFAKRFLEAVDRTAKTDAAVPSTPSWLTPRWAPWALAAALVLCLAMGWQLVQGRQIRAQLADTQARLVEADRQKATLTTELATQQRANTAAQESLAQAQAAPPDGPVALVLLPLTRGIGPVPIVAIGPETRTVPFSLAVEGADRSPYEADLRDPATNTIVWRSGPLASSRARPAPLVAVGIPAAILKSQHYAIDIVTLRPSDAPDFVASYAFEVIRR